MNWWLINIVWNNNNAWIKSIEEASIKSDRLSITAKDSFWDSQNITMLSIKELIIYLLSIIKTIINWLLVLFLVYAWANMIFYNGSNESLLEKAKMQINYTLVWLVFLNLPWTLAYSLRTSWNWTINKDVNNFKWDDIQLLFNSEWQLSWIINNVIIFLEVVIWAIAVIMIIIAWLKLILDRGKWDNIEESKNKILYSVIALILISFIETFKYFVFNTDIATWEKIFQKISNMWLLFVWPLAIASFVYAGYLYVTSWWDETKADKAKKVFINTVFWILIMLSTWSILSEIDF